MRTTFASAAIAATASAVRFDAMAIPDFIAGFIYGLTGDNHLTEIEACYTGGETIVEDAELALSEITSGEFIKGSLEFYKVVQQFPVALANCENMGEDLTEIETWAQVFTEPEVLVKKASKNWLLHKNKVKSDIAQEETDWAAGDYFDAGKDTAFAIDVLVPFPKTVTISDVGMDIMAVPDFAAGFLYGMVGDNHLTEFETCFTSSEQLMPYINAFITDLESFKIIAAFENFEKFLFHFQLDVEPCHNLGDDITAIEQWAAIFKEPTQLVTTLTKHWLLHQKAIKADIAAEKSDWALGDYFKAGEDIADAVTLAVGPVEPAQANLGLNLKGDAEFVAGFLYGMVGDNNLTEIEACYAGTEPLVGDVEAFIGDLEHLHFIKAFEVFESFLFHFQVDMEPCHAMSDDMASLQAWAAQFKDIPLLLETVAKHYLIHKRGIKKDIAQEKADWSVGNYFKAGADIADAVTLLLGPMNEPAAKVPNRAYLNELQQNGLFGEVTHILAGFIYGMTEDNHLTELEACYGGGHEMEQEVMKAISDFKLGGWDNITQGVLEIAIVALQLPQELHTCENMQDDLGLIEAWAGQFTDIATLIPALTKHFLFHKAAIEADIGILKTDMAAQEYFQVGLEAADIATILLPIQ